MPDEVAPLALIVPVLNEAQTIDVFCQQHQAVFESYPLVFVDGGSTDGTPDLLKAMGFLVLTSEAGRGIQMNAGAQAVTAQYLLFLHADTHLPESFCTDFSQWCASRPAWGYFQVVLDDQRWVYRVIERAINLRSRLFRNPTGDQALIISQPVFQHLGGYHTLPLMEDVAITDQLRSHYLPKVMRNPVVTSSRRWQTRGVLNTVLLMWKIRLLYRLGESPSKLAKLYR